MVLPIGDPRTAEAKGTLERGTGVTGVPESIQRIKIYGIAIVDTKEGRSFPLKVGELPELVPGAYEWRLVFSGGSREAHVLVRDGKEIARWDAPNDSRFRELTQLLQRAGGHAACQVVAPDSNLTQPRASAASIAPIQPQGDLELLFVNFAMRPFVRDLIVRSGASKRAPPDDAMTFDQAMIFAQSTPDAATIASYVAQAWAEMQKAKAPDIKAFFLLAETLIQQWEYGNGTVWENKLEIRLDQEGLGLYHRDKRFARYYDEEGRPVAGYDGRLRDSGYLTFRSPIRPVPLTTGPNTLPKKFVHAVRQIYVDETIEFMRLGKTAVQLGEMVAEEVRRGWEPWPQVAAALQEQAGPFIAFAAVEGFAWAVRKFGKPPWSLVGWAMHVVLDVVGKFFLIGFTASSFLRLLSIGKGLVHVKYEPGTPLDSISQRHLDTAVEELRNLLVDVLVIGLQAGMLRSARLVAGTAAKFMGPPGGPPPMAPVVLGPKGEPGGVLPAAFTPEADAGLRFPQWMAMGNSGRGRRRDSREGAIAKDRPNRNPDGPKNFTREEKTFKKIMEGLRLHIKTYFTDKGLPNPIIDLNESILTKPSGEFIDGNETLSRAYQRALAVLEANITSELKAEKLATAAQRKILADIHAKNANKLTNDLLQLRSLHEGLVENKRPDLVEFYFETLKVVITDETGTPFKEVHNFKTLYYVEVIRTWTSFFEVFGLEWKGAEEFQQKLIDEPPLKLSDE
jgi:hypothetical protein